MEEEANEQQKKESETLLYWNRSTSVILKRVKDVGTIKGEKMTLDIISIGLSACILLVILLLHWQTHKRIKVIRNAQQQILRRFNFFLENVQVQSINQDDEFQPEEQVEDVEDIGGSWEKQFADGFISYLRERESRLVRIFMGNTYGGYPEYTGFDIRRSGTVNIGHKNAFWLVAFIGIPGTIFLKLHMNNPDYFDRLESQRSAIDKVFGSDLLWEKNQGRSPSRIGIDYKVDPLSDNKQAWNDHYEMMRVTLEKLDTVFQHRIEEIFDEDDTPF